MKRKKEEREFTPPTSCTGGEGIEFETEVDALFSALMYCGTLPPFPQGRISSPITSVTFQTNVQGMETDDLLATLENGTRILCGIKRTWDYCAFRDLLSDAWKDYAGNVFRHEK